MSVLCWLARLVRRRRTLEDVAAEIARGLVTGAVTIDAIAPVERARPGEIVAFDEDGRVIHLGWWLPQQPGGPPWPFRSDPSPAS